MRKQFLSVAMLTTLTCGSVYGADEPAVPPPPSAQPIVDTPPEPAVPTTPVPAVESTDQTPAGEPRGTRLQDYGWYWYRPEAVVPGTNAGLHPRYPYYSYRRPWYPAGPASVNVTIIW
jgi:hypothetical protein